MPSKRAVAAHLHCCTELSMRLYRQAWGLKIAGMDWRGYILSRYLNDRARLAAELLADTRFATKEDRAAAFEARGGGCRSTFFTYADNLKAVAPPLALKVLGKPRVAAADAAWINRLRRFGPFKES
jgi:hypothetical protein